MVSNEYINIFNAISALESFFARDLKALRTKNRLLEFRTVSPKFKIMQGGNDDGSSSLDSVEEKLNLEHKLKHKLIGPCSPKKRNRPFVVSPHGSVRDRQVAISVSLYVFI